MQIERNIGMISIQEQQKIKESRIAILGVGGLGGPLAIILAQAGCEHLVIADFDIIERSNLNRQPYTEADIGKLKIDALEERLLAVNPEIEIKKYAEITPQNIGDVLDGVNVIALSLDGPLGSIIVTREANRLKIPVVEGWATPMIVTRWFTPESLDYESTYGLHTHQYSIEQIKQSSELQNQIKMGFYDFFKSIPHVEEDYSHEPNYYEAMMNGQIGLRSFSPIVWMIATYLSLDLIYAGILNRKKKILSPEIHGFDFLRMEPISL